MKTLKEAFAVTGYVADKMAEQLGSTWSGSVDIKPERGHDEVVMRVHHDQIREVRLGSSINGETLVQLVLHENADVETVFRSTASLEGITRLSDPTLAHLTAKATVKMILGP